MPIVRQPVPQVQESAFTGQRPGARATPDAFGASVGQGMEIGGRQIAAVVERERLAADEIAVLEADRKLAQWENDNIFNPETGALTRRGKDALPLPDEYGQRLQTTIGEIETGLANDLQRLAFRRSAGRRQIEIERRLQTHVAGEIGKIDQAETEASLSNSVAIAGASFDNPERIALELARGDALIAGWAERNGVPLDSEAAKAQAGKFRDQVHTSVLNSLLANEMPAEARDYMAANGDDITDPELRSKMKDAVRLGGLRAEAQQETARIMGMGLTEAQALAYARKNVRSDTQDDVVTRIKVQYGEREEAKNRGEQNRFKAADQILQQSNGSLDAIPPALWNDLTIAQQAQLKDLATYVRTGRPSSDPNVYAGIENIKRTSPEAFAKMDLSAVRQYLSPSEYRGFQNEQTQLALAGRNADASVKVTHTRTFDQIFRDNAVAIPGYRDDKPFKDLSDEVRQQYRELNEEARTAVEALERNVLKRQATPDEMTAEIKRVTLRKVSLRTTFGNKEVMNRYLTEDDRGRAYIPVDRIPDEDADYFEKMAMRTVFKGVKPEAMSGRQRRQLTALIEDAAAAKALNDVTRYNNLFGGEAAVAAALKQRD